MSQDDGPQIVRPVPRRPFQLNVASSSTRDADSDTSARPPSPSSASRQQASCLSTGSGAGRDADSSISRATSMMNLTSSTLSGIYAPTEEPETPWGTGAQTPIKRFTLQEQQEFSAIELDKEHSSMLRRRLSTTRSPPRDFPRPRSLQSAAGLAVRALLLFALGMGYGALVTRLRGQHLESMDFDDNEATAGVQDGIMHPGSDWRYLLFWGAIGVVLGSLLPWFDGVWDKAFGDDDSAVDLDPVVAMEQLKQKQEQEAKAPSTDWVLVVRGIGAFVGIVFALRRLPWTSSLQASTTLALINPFLWYLIDRSKPGFLLSAFVGLAGSAILLGLNPHMMRPPVGGDASTTAWLHGYGNHSGSDSYPGAEADGSETRSNDGRGNLMLGGLATQETVESGVWMLSVLFCSCVCFGNIGRRLAWQRGAAVRGRWGGVR